MTTLHRDSGYRSDGMSQDAGWYPTATEIARAGAVILGIDYAKMAEASVGGESFHEGYGDPMVAKLRIDRALKRLLTAQAHLTHLEPTDHMRKCFDQIDEAIAELNDFWRRVLDKTQPPTRSADMPVQPNQYTQIDTGSAPSEAARNVHNAVQVMRRGK